MAYPKYDETDLNVLIGGTKQAIARIAHELGNVTPPWPENPSLLQIRQALEAALGQPIGMMPGLLIIPEGLATVVYTHLGIGADPWSHPAFPGHQQVAMNGPLKELQKRLPPDGSNLIWRFAMDLLNIQDDLGLEGLQQPDFSVHPPDGEEFVTRNLNLALQDVGACQFYKGQLLVPECYSAVIYQHLGDPASEPHEHKPGTIRIQLKNQLLELVNPIKDGQIPELTPA